MSLRLNIQTSKFDVVLDDAVDINVDSSTFSNNLGPGDTNVQKALETIDDISLGNTTSWGDILGTLSDQTDLQNALDNKADIIHTHVASEITDFDIEVSNNADVADNTSKAHDQNTDTALRTDKLVVDSNGNTEIKGELTIKVYVQATEPLLGGNKRIAIWEDTSNNRTNMLYKDSLGNQKIVEFS